METTIKPPKVSLLKNSSLEQAARPFSESYLFCNVSRAILVSFVFSDLAR